MPSDRQDRPDFSADYGPAASPSAPSPSQGAASPPKVDPSAAVSLGDFFVGPPVGEGGFATVHVGWQASTGRKVAVKILHDGQPTEQVARFQKEAAYLARFNHPNIVSVLGFGHATWTAGPASELDPDWLANFRQSAPAKTFIALEWIDGRTLEQVYRAGRDNPAAWPGVRTLAEWFAQAAGALAAVHATGLIHRDVKPSNLMVTADGAVKLMDFGIARSQDGNRTLMTATGHVCGTLAYMSPEQVRAADSEALIGPASDIYSLCATFYELFTRTRLLQHDTQGPATIHTLKLSGAAPQRPRTLATGVPWEIETIVMGGLEPEVPDRFRSMDALEADLRRFLADEPIRYRSPSPRRRMALGYRRHRTAVNLAAIFLLAAAVGIGLYIRSIRQEQARTLAQKQLADEQRDLARQREHESQARLASAFEEQGRQELLALADRPTRAAVFLSEAYSRGRDGAATRYLLAQAMRAVPASAPAYRGHTRGGYTAEYSPDNSRIVTAGRDGCVKIWKGPTGELLHTLTLSPTHEVNGAMFSPDGRCVVAANDGGQAAVWDADSCDLICTLPHRGEVAWATFSPDGNLKLVLTASRDATAAVWDASTGKQLHSLAGHSDYVRLAVFSSDGRKIVTASRDYTARVWDAATGQHIATLDGHRGLLTCAAFSPDGSLVVTASEDGQAIVWDAQTGKLLTVLRGHLSDVCWAQFSPDGSRIVTASEDHTVRIWDATLETRPADEIARIIRDRVPWRLEGERLVPVESTPPPASIATSRPAVTQREP